MTAPDPRLGEIEARLARRDAMIEDGSDKITRTRCNDPERDGFHSQHPYQVSTETSHHNSYISHLEALADSVPYLLTELRKRDNALAAIEKLLHEKYKLWAEICGNTCSKDILGVDHDAIADEVAAAIRAAVTAAKGGGE